MVCPSWAADLSLCSQSLWPRESFKLVQWELVQWLQEACLRRASTYPVPTLPPTPPHRTPALQLIHVQPDVCTSLSPDWKGGAGKTVDLEKGKGFPGTAKAHSESLL